MNLGKLSLKNIFRHKRRSYMLIGAIAFSVLIIFFLNLFTNGLSFSIKQNYSTKFQGHIYIQGKLSSSEHLPLILDAIDKSGADVKYTTKVNSFKGNLIGNTRSVFQEVTGLELNNRDFTDNLDLLRGEIGGSGTIILSESLAKKLDVAMGEVITLSMSTFAGQVNVEDFILTGLLKDQADGEYYSYINLSDSARLLNLPKNSFLSYNIFLNNLNDMERVSDSLLVTLKESMKILTLEERREIMQASRPEGAPLEGMRPPGGMPGSGGGGGMGGRTHIASNPELDASFTISTLEDRLDRVLDVVNLMGNISIGVFVILLLITMVGISNTFRMIILERTSEIGTMRAVGMKKRYIRRLFIYEALFISAIGLVVGVAVGSILTLMVGTIPLDIPEYKEFLYKGHLYFKPEFLSLGISLSLLVIFTTAASLKSSNSGANLKTVDALRYEG